MGYAVKEMYYTLQGEGTHAGRPAVFLRFAGCNLWSGREEDRSSAVCTFCDTDFVGVDGPGGGKHRDADSLADEVLRHWSDVASSTGIEERRFRYVVCTGGEPLLQLDEALIEALHRRDFQIAIETNGTIEVPKGVDWVCVSPKADAEVVVTSGNELKLVYPQAMALPERFAHLEFEHFYLQPMDGERRAENTSAAIAYCLEHPKWNLSVQTHKDLGIL